MQGQLASEQQVMESSCCHWGLQQALQMLVSSYGPHAGLLAGCCFPSPYDWYMQAARGAKGNGIVQKDVAPLL